MKNILMLFATIALALSLHAQPKITFETETLDYGTIDQDSEPTREFHFTNTGTEPLVISNCQGTCGCTVPTCPKEAYQPGESGKIVVRYDTHRAGVFNKGVKVYSNASPADQPITINIKGNVQQKEVPVQDQSQQLQQNPNPMPANQEQTPQVAPQEGQPH